MMVTCETLGEEERKKLKELIAKKINYNPSARSQSKRMDWYF